MPEEYKETISPSDLVLRLSEKANNFDISKYEDFIAELCGEREYQIEATRRVIKFFLSGEYKNIGELVSENFKTNEAMQEFFRDEGELLGDLLFRDKLSCTIDLATGTGKTWVMYAVARIMLAEGVVDNVLIVGPSRTIKDEIWKKFNNFTIKTNLQSAFPKDGKYRNPGIIKANTAIKKGDIVIDNIHKAYDHVGSSIKDLRGKDRKILIINDEAHHFINSTAGGLDKEEMLEWAKFLRNPEYNFAYILNSSGTPYKGDNYFKDVIYRYPIRQAIEDRMVKDINYLEKDESRGWKQKFRAIYRNHIENKREYPKVKKHITIFVTNQISKTDKIADEIRKFLRTEEGISAEEAKKKVLPVTSAQKHKENRELLKTVDEPENPVEWIVSVSMLTEGWDVNNVFQIVPHEDRAFNSKLLIAQVLGRGLRVPPVYQNDAKIHPQVTIFNHDAWGPRIDDLVRDVAEISKKITSKVDKESKYNFSVYWMNVEKKIVSDSKTPARGKIELPKSLGFSSRKDITEQIYRSVRTREETIKRTKIDLEEYSIKEAVNEVFNNILLLDLTHNTNFAEKANRKFIENLIEKELEDIGEKTVTEANLQRAKSSFNTLYRQLTGQSRIVDVYSDPIEKTTKEMNSSFISISEVKKNKGIMFSEESLKSSTAKELENINEALDEIKGKYSIKIDEDDYKSPLNVTVLASEPEIDFAKILTRKENAKFIDCWVKSKDKGFYSIPYNYRPGTHPQQKQFNPDFIIKKGGRIIFVETKHDEDTDVKNRDKIAGANDYFMELNAKVEKEGQEYCFYFLTPADYTGFFEKVIRNNKTFIGELHAELLKKSREELKELV
ncbi:MAG TPA: DEAD/DEAH box helicase family protein [bacterium]|nr:DEAD/DEAH box helicase family protein [Paludibacteraceae bacterium]HPL01691.1 DEAD/DEAH box helicase family protein [bacterium]HQI26181.1 DEAD/DEAH box helicase family protein [Candidatus Paceibacterota bacterium]